MQCRSDIELAFRPGTASSGNGNDGSDLQPAVAADPEHERYFFRLEESRLRLPPRVQRLILSCASHGEKWHSSDFRDGMRRPGICNYAVNSGAPETRSPA